MSLQHDGGHVVVVGTPFSDDGMALFGPFADHDEALEWAQEEWGTDPYEIVEVHPVT